MIPKIDKEKTGRRLHMFMQLRGLSVQDVRAFLSLACVQSVYHWLSGQSLPTLDNLYALSGLLRVPVDMLIAGDRECLVCECTQQERLLFYYGFLVYFSSV